MSRLCSLSVLRQRGRTPATPFAIDLGNNRVLEITKLLRVLPGKRIVGKATLSGTPVLAKLFIAERTSQRDWSKEHQGLLALNEKGIPSPRLLEAMPLPNGGHLLLTEYLEESIPLDILWDGLLQPAGNPEAVQILAKPLGLLAQMHQAGLKHGDLHPGNFLCRDQQCWVIDGDSISSADQPLEEQDAAENLGMFLAQLPAIWDWHTDALLASYVTQGGLSLKPGQLKQSVMNARAWRMADYLSKTVRDCSLFAAHTHFQRFEVCPRAGVARAASFFESPDQYIEHGKMLKAGNTCTVASGIDAQGPWVIKRYNIKGMAHALQRCWRPSRAWHSWKEGWRLLLLGIPTPRPIALVEERLGKLRRKAWLLTELCPGKDLLSHLTPNKVPEAPEAQALRELFQILVHLRITHGDLKASNLLWHDGKIWLIDLDACTWHRTEKTWKSAWVKDRQRFLRNWPVQSPLHQWLERNLPPA